MAGASGCYPECRKGTEDSISSPSAFLERIRLDEEAVLKTVGLKRFASSSLAPTANLEACDNWWSATLEAWWGLKALESSSLSASSN